MLRTKDEAENTRCCRDQSSTCITTLCMAWRWDIEDFETQQENYEDAPAYAPPGSVNPEPVARGFCGLAGKP